MCYIHSILGINLVFTPLWRILFACQYHPWAITTGCRVCPIQSLPLLSFVSYNIASNIVCLFFIKGLILFLSLLMFLLLLVLLLWFLFILLLRCLWWFCRRGLFFILALLVRWNLLLWVFLLFWILTCGLLFSLLILFTFLFFVFSLFWALLLDLHIVFCLVVFVPNLTSIRFANNAEVVFFSNINPVVLLPFFPLSWTLCSPTFGFVNGVVSFKDHSRFEGYFLKIFAVWSIYMRLRAFLYWWNFSA